MSGAAATARPGDARPTLSEWLPVIAWCTVIFILSGSTFSAANTARIIDPALRWLIPGLSQPGAEMLHALIRKTAHFTEYGILFFLMIRGPMKGRPYTALMLCVAYAFVDEGHQAFMPGRTASLYDVALDGTGALFSRFVQLAIAELA
jgi:VanZ family protein